jgi:hypothetical protein
MIDYERKGIYLAINVQTNRTDSAVLRPKILGYGVLEEIVKYATETVNTSPREFVFAGSQKKISCEMLEKLGKLPEGIRDQAVSSIVHAIPSSVETIVLNKLPSKIPKSDI